MVIILYMVYTTRYRKMKILQTMVSGMTPVLGLRSRAHDLCVCVVFGVPIIASVTVCTKRFWLTRPPPINSWKTVMARPVGAGSAELDNNSNTPLLVSKYQGP